MTDSSVLTENCKLLWAKSDPWHPLWKHLLDVAAVSLALPPPASDFGWSPEATALLVGLHDIGKADSAFQHQVPQFAEALSKAGYKPTGDAPCRHERISARFIEKKLKQQGLDSFVANAISRVLVAHHGYWNETARPSASAYEGAQEQFWHMLQHVLGHPSLNSDTSKESNLSALGMRLAGHVVLCDWIASNEKFFGDARLKGFDDSVSYFAKAREVAREWTSRLGFERNPQDGQPANIVKETRPIQQTLLDTDIPPGLVIIEAPMGEGKTEAAWILAEKWRAHGYYGLYMALPTMATSDSLYSRYRDDYLNKLERGESAKLVHGMAWLRGVDDTEPEKPAEVGEPGDDRSLAAAWFRPTRRAMLAAHGVGTVDQVMLAGMNVKFGFLRLYGLANRVLVIDEVHAYDAYMSTIITRLLQWCACLKIPVILLSATLSAAQRKAMIEAYGAKGDPGPDAPYPLITVAEPGKEVWTIATAASSTRTLQVETHPGFLGDAKKAAKRAEQLVKDGGCCCVILNTVKQAQAVYKELKLSSGEKLLFHSRFTAEDRQRITEKVLDLFGKGRWVGEGAKRRFKPAERPQKCVLVATQIVEQSLDVDFDCMISEIAPIDLLLQRSGRLHRRRTRSSDPVLHVLMPEEKDLHFGGTGYVYAKKPLFRTMAIFAALPPQRAVHLPQDFRVLIERCYGASEWEQSAIEWEEIRKADSDWEAATQELSAQGAQFTLCEPSPRRFRPVSNDPTGDDSDDGNGWRAKTRFGVCDQTAVLLEEGQIQRLQGGEIPMEEVRTLYRRSLKLPAYLPIDKPDSGCSAGIRAEGKLRGLLLIPLAGDGRWQGADAKGNHYEIHYDTELGLLAGRMQ